MTDEIRRALMQAQQGYQVSSKAFARMGHSNYGLQKGEKVMKDMYPVDTPDFTFSIGWLGKFKARYGIKNFRRFGESGSVEMEGMEDKLKSIRDKVGFNFWRTQMKVVKARKNIPEFGSKSWVIANAMDVERVLTHPEKM
ncbi:hypothetical protein Tco_0226452 [Tanacetum coccineum]|uniref:HTH CENPB-type domain-containing protein n=1 Tax=Tanacetum coccineum TaxID=301880 RepID=A0ABQ5J8U8_9ASTR